MGITTIGALLGLTLAIILIIYKFHPAYSLILGALVGGLIGLTPLVTVVQQMISGASSMMPAVLRILTSGILVGALIKTRSAEKIAATIVDTMGEKRAIIAIAVATMIICAVGVFVDIAVITVAPIALAVGERVNSKTKGESRITKAALLLAMIGGGKAGNIISPNPNTIATADAFNLDLTTLMMANIIPAICALGVTILLAKLLSKAPSNSPMEGENTEHGQVSPLYGGTEGGLEGAGLPAFWKASLGPLVVILLLALRPLFGIAIDPLIALPVGGLTAIFVTGHWRDTFAFTEFGLSKVIGVSILLLGTGTIAGIISASALKTDMIALLEWLNMPAFILAPISGILMAGATASTTAGATIASQTFAGALTASGVPAVSAAAMIHAGATVIDSLPHGSFFHATGGSVFMDIKSRMRLIPYEACIGLTSTIVSVIVYLLS